MIKVKKYFPDNTIIDDWFYDYSIPNINSVKNRYVLTDYNVFDDGNVYTKEIQNLIDLIHNNGGGTLIVPKGTFITGSIFFKQGVNLYIEEGGVLKGSDDISDYEIRLTRIEGETCKYYVALINADGVDGFMMYGKGVIDGNGLKSWKAFWKRREWNPKCTNKDEQRPRLVYISNSSNCIIAGLKLINSHFWTNHIYKCNHIKFINCYIYSPYEPIKAPSTDAIDIDVCSYVLVKNCYIEVNDDAVVLKGGKGPWADKDINNGSNEKIIVEDCEFGFCHGCLTCGSESIHNKNIIVRRISVKDSKNLLWLKMRPDTPQLYEYIRIENVEGKINNFININPWTQFFDLKDRLDIPISFANNIEIKNCKCDCNTFFFVKKDDNHYKLSNFNFTNLEINTIKDSIDETVIDNFKLINVNIKKVDKK